MNKTVSQTRLSAAQLEAFYHDDFVNDQVRDFRELVGATGNELVVDIGGGCGFFAHQLAGTAGYPTRVVDMDAQSIASCRQLGVDARAGDALAPTVEGDERVYRLRWVGRAEPASHCRKVEDAPAGQRDGAGDCGYGTPAGQLKK